ncbi:MAG: DUF4271 domain-containing protein [Crocinitomicaceae bacterium]|nr:DUF4271 domain-containing protein [Crocinitomicaceae bacterium]MCF8434009.1 DUF4271 domain-containing protein [Crocinitomicaceae bacterium]
MVIHLLFFHFFDSSSVDIPMTLTSKENGSHFYLGILLFVAFLVLAFVRTSNNKAIISLGVLFLTATNVDQRLKETMRLSSFSSIGLLLNYFLVSFVCNMLLFESIGLFSAVTNLLLSLLIPVSLFVIQFIPIYVFLFISGTNFPIVSFSANTLIGLQLNGLIYTLIALVWILNPQWSFALMMLFTVLLFLFAVARIIKNSYLVLTEGVAWYYIILYFCTLEILPLFVAVNYIRMNFLN